jgi:hypothetical protein
MEKAMPQLHDFEDPSSLAGIVSGYLEHAAQIYGSFFKPVRQTCDQLWQGTEILASSAMEFNEKALSYAGENVEANFELVHHLIEVRDLEAALEIQTAFANQRVKSCVRQTRETSSLLAQAMQDCFWRQVAIFSLVPAPA